MQPGCGPHRVAEQPVRHGGGNVTVSVQQWSVTPSTPTVPTGLVSFAVTDKGTIKHEFVVLRTDTPASEIPIESFEGEKDRINEDAAGTNVGETGDMRPGATKTITIDLKPGHYVLFCNLPGHYGMGMHTEFTVT